MGCMVVLDYICVCYSITVRSCTHSNYEAIVSLFHRLHRPDSCCQCVKHAGQRSLGLRLHVAMVICVGGSFLQQLGCIG